MSKTFSNRGRRGPDAVTVALNKVSLYVGAGEIVALVGESGSGKSTLARIVTRTLDADDGTMRFDGESVAIRKTSRPSLSYRKSVQMIFQDPFGSLNPVNRVGYHIARPLIRHARATRENVRNAVLELLESVGLTPAEEFIDRFPHELSGGQRQRVAIARALAPEPQLILADEPTSMLDVSVRMDVLALLRSLRDQRGLTFLLITHDLASARHLADRFVVLYAGHIVESGETNAVIEDPKHPYTHRLLAAAPGSAWKAPERPHGTAHRGPQGCAFAGSCGYADARCTAEKPAITEVSATHQVACHHWSNIAWP